MTFIDLKLREKNSSKNKFPLNLMIFCVNFLVTNISRLIIPLESNIVFDFFTVHNDSFER